MFSCLGKIFGCFGINGRATYRSKEQCPKNFGCSSKSESAGDSSILNPMKRSICHAERVENCERRSNFNFNYVELQQTGLSTKATNSGHGEDSAYFEGWHEYDRNPYDPLNNPSGVIQMGLAENQLSIDMLESWLKEHPEASISFNQNAGTSLFKELALYQDYHGLPAFKKAIASFMEAVRGNKVKFDPDNIVLTAGATAANELLMFCLADPGAAFLVPTPYYPGFARDLRWRTGVEIVPVHCESSNEFQITKCALETAYGEAQKQNLNVRGLIVTNPSNPLGTTLSAKALRNLLSFVQEKKIHLVCDEIYSGSVFSPPSFHSVAEILAKENHICDNVHIVYSLSKDLGLPGFRVGAIYSYNNTVVKTARRMSSFCMVSSQTQHMLSTLLSDSKFMSNFISENHKRLQERHRFLVSGLQKADIICLNSNAGLFCWVDMRHLLPSHDVKGELKLWKSILDEVGLNISPGSSFHCKEPGWFRVCFANMNQPTLQVSLERIQSFVKNNQSNKKLGTEGVCQCKALQCNMSPCAGTKRIRNKLIREQSSLDQMDQNESQS